MPSLIQLPSGRWRVRLRIDGKQIERRFKTKREATAWKKQMTSDEVMGTFVRPERSKVSVQSVADVWLQNPSWKASTRARNESIVRAYIAPKWGSKPLSAVQYEAVQGWVNDLSKELSPATVAKVLGVFRGILQVAVKSRRLAVNPAKDVDLPRSRVKPRRYLSASQVEALAEASDGNSVIVYVLAYCGLRFGELAGLQVENVDLMRRRFRIEHSVTEVNGKLDHSSPKDHQRRSVPYPSFLDDDVSVLVSAGKFGEKLFKSQGGGVLRVRNVRRDWFDFAVKTVGLEGLTPHELRHTAASLAISAGATPLGVQRMLGHEKASMTLDVYSDLFDADLDDVAERLGNLRAKSREGSLRVVGPEDSGKTKLQAL